MSPPPPALAAATTTLALTVTLWWLAPSPAAHAQTTPGGAGDSAAAAQAEPAPTPFSSPLEEARRRLLAQAETDPAQPGPGDATPTPTPRVVPPPGVNVPPTEATTPAPTPAPAGATVGSGDQLSDARIWSFEFPNVEVEDAVLEYQKITGDHVIYDVTASGSIKLLSNPDRKMTASEAVEFIKTSLLLNGFAIVPVRPGMVKVLNWSSKPPTSEGEAETFRRPLDPLLPEGANLPNDERIINYVMDFTYVPPEEAVAILDAAVPKTHTYAVRTPVPNAGVVIITDTVPVIRSLIEIKKTIDVDPARFEDKMIELTRADAEEVATIVQEILTRRTAQRTGQTAGRTAAAPATNTARPADGSAALAEALQAQANNNTGAGGGEGPDAKSSGIPDENTVIIQAVPRLNSILVFAMQRDIVWIEEIIHQLDAEARFDKFLQRQLRFMPVTDFIGVAADTLARGLDESALQGGTGATGTSLAGVGNRNNSNFRNNQLGNSTAFGNQLSGNRGAFGNQFGGGGGFGTAPGGGFASAQTSVGGLSSPSQPPVAATIGKTLLIADPPSNSLIVSGPPEQLATIDELINRIDRRPRQVYISAIIAQVRLGDQIEFGVDLLRTVETINVNGTPTSAAGIFNTIQNGTGIIDPLLLEQVSDFAEAGLLGAGGLNTYFGIGEFLNAYVKALEGTSRFQVLARPSLFMANNATATLESGSEVPVVTSQQSTVITGGNAALNSAIDFRQVLLSLQVRPLINSSDEVTLEVAQRNDDIAGTTTINGDAVPIIATQTLQTFVNVPNGSVVLLGGLIQEDDDHTHVGLPLIARIPILNKLIGYNNFDRSRTELLIFLQPIIIDDTAELVDVNLNEVRRTYIGREALKMANPRVDDPNILVPTWDPATGTQVYRPRAEVEAEKRAAERARARQGTAYPTGAATPAPAGSQPVPGPTGGASSSGFQSPAKRRSAPHR